MVSSNGKGDGHVAAVLRRGKPYFAAERFQTFWLIEIMAQAVASQAGFSYYCKGERPPLGFIISIDDYELYSGEEAVEDLGEGSELAIDVKLEHELLPVALFAVKVTARDVEVARARMKFVIIEGKGA